MSITATVSVKLIYVGKQGEDESRPLDFNNTVSGFLKKIRETTQERKFKILYKGGIVYDESKSSSAQAASMTSLDTAIKGGDTITILVLPSAEESKRLIGLHITVIKSDMLKLRTRLGLLRALLN